MNTEDSKTTYKAICASATHQAIVDASRYALEHNRTPPLELYVRAAQDGNDGAIRMVIQGQAPPEDYEHLGSRTLPTTLAYDRYAAWIESNSSMAPLVAKKG